MREVAEIGQFGLSARLLQNL